MPNLNSEQQIRELAHQLWESEGRPEGQSEKHWKLAVRLLEADSSNAHPHAKPPSNPKRSTDPSEKTGDTEPEQPDQT